MKFDKMAKWTEVLLACSVVRDRKKRNTIVDKLPEGIRDHITRDETDKIDVLNILQRTLDIEEGLTQFIEVLRFFEGETHPMRAVDQLYEQTYPATPITEYTDPPQETYYYPAVSLHPILDRKEPVEIFRQLLDPDHICRFMRLSGAAKMGKSHLLTKVFPALAQQAGARIAIMDMRGSQTVINWLHHICTQLGMMHFPKFDKAYQERLNQTPLPGQDIQAISSAINARGHQREDTLHMVPHFTRLLVDDLRHLNDRPIVLLCDAVDDAKDYIQTWLMDSLLVQLQPLRHLHIVVGGRTLPKASGNYAMICQDYELRPVQEKEPYIRYCIEIESDLREEEISALAHAFAYVPGEFVNTVNDKFMDGSYAHV